MFGLCKIVFSQPDVLGLAEAGELEVQMFNLAQIYNKIPNAQLCTSAPVLANPCYLPSDCLKTIFLLPLQA